MKSFNQKITNLPDSEIEIEAELAWDHFLPYRSKTLNDLKKTVEIKGFRPGHTPDDVLAKHVGEGTLLQEAAKDAVAETYGKIIEEEKIRVIGFPDVKVTKLAEGNPLGFTARVSVVPEFTLPDYKKIASAIMSKKEDVIEVTEKDLTAAIDEIRLNIARAEHDHKHKTGEPHEHVESDKDLPLPPVTDEFVSMIGNFKNVDDFKTKIKDGLLKEKTMLARDKRRGMIGEELIKKTKLETPKTLIEHELEKIDLRFKLDVERMGLKIEDYLKHIKKSADELKKEWLPDAKKRATLQLIVSTIANQEKLFPTAEEIAAETEILMKEHKGATRDRVESYVTLVLANEKVFDFLEKQK